MRMEVPVDGEVVGGASSLSAGVAGAGEAVAECFDEGVGGFESGFGDSFAADMVLVLWPWRRGGQWMGDGIGWEFRRRDERLLANTMFPRIALDHVACLSCIQSHSGCLQRPQFVDFSPALCCVSVG